LKRKSNEISNIFEELRTAQLKLMESGKLSAVASLSAGILHQISQPITAIHGFAKFLIKEMNPKDVFYQPIQHIEEQSVYIKEMLRDLMELIRHREIKKESVNVNNVIKRAMNLLTDELRISRINWDLNLEDPLPPVLADAIHLQQVFMNIVINAIQVMQHMPQGKMRYIAINSKHDRDKDFIIITFQDTGPGLKMEEKLQAFDPFFSTRVEGAGIGLMLSQDLIAEHGGTIEVESKPDKGATFIIRLPCMKKKEMSTV